MGYDLNGFFLVFCLILRVIAALFLIQKALIQVVLIETPLRSVLLPNSAAEVDTTTASRACNALLPTFSANLAST